MDPINACASLDVDDTHLRYGLSFCCDTSPNLIFIALSFPLELDVGIYTLMGMRDSSCPLVYDDNSPLVCVSLDYNGVIPTTNVGEH